MLSSMTSMHLPRMLVSFAASLSSSRVHAGWIDEDTPSHLRTTTSLVDGSAYDLVMSDEFNVPGRTFADGHDPTWTALDKSDDDYSASGGGSLHFYNSSTVVTTDDGMLTIRSILDVTRWTHYDPTKREYAHETKHFKSGMVQSWDKFCFTGGIVEVDVILPGEPDIGGLWPAIWLLGNLGRATYEVSTNNLWPWSYDDCDREKQQSQAISGCNSVNHFGLNPKQGRGATEIDILELMAGETGVLPSTYPPISLPYVDMTLQVAPGIPDNRPQSGLQPVRTKDFTHSGYATSQPENWYDNLTVAGNTSLNPFFYGTYLGPTKPNEPVTRTKAQAFQADAVGAMKQLVPEHFRTPHTFRVEWQPGRGGRIDWFTKSYRKIDPDTGDIFHMEGDGKGRDWEHTLSIPDSALESAMGSKVPEEPSYLIFNTAISSTWAFPYDVPDWCPKCYDCYDPKCTCSFNPGFCNMMKTGRVSMKIDSVRVYQSNDDTAHSGRPHSLGCDPLDFPTREYIKGYEYKYMRNPPFSFHDKKPLKDVMTGGGVCVVDEDCGGIGGSSSSSSKKSGDHTTNVEEEDTVLDLDVPLVERVAQGSTTTTTTTTKENDAVDGRRLASPNGGDGREIDFSPIDTKTKSTILDKPDTSDESLKDDAGDTKVPPTASRSNHLHKPKGQCVSGTRGVFGMPSSTGKQCQCNEGYTGPHCLSVDKYDEKPGAYELKKVTSLFKGRVGPYFTTVHVVFGGTLIFAFFFVLIVDTSRRGRERERMMEMKPLQNGFQK